MKQSNILETIKNSELFEIDAPDALFVCETEEIAYKSRPGFIALTDGGTSKSYYFSSDTASQQLVGTDATKDHERNEQFMLENFKDEKRLESDFYEWTESQQEEFYDYEDGNRLDIVVGVKVQYYRAGNGHSDLPGKDSVFISAYYNSEMPYYRESYNKSFYTCEKNFESIAELKKILNESRKELLDQQSIFN